MSSVAGASVTKVTLAPYFFRRLLNEVSSQLDRSVIAAAYGGLLRYLRALLQAGTASTGRQGAIRVSELLCARKTDSLL